jgi:hypothetical protein
VGLHFRKGSRPETDALHPCFSKNGQPAPESDRMLSASDTAYPLLKASPSARELDEFFTPNLFELTFAEKHTRQPSLLVGLLILLKTFQRLGYFVQVADIPRSIVRQVVQTVLLQLSKSTGIGSARQLCLVVKGPARTAFR